VPAWVRGIALGVALLAPAVAAAAGAPRKPLVYAIHPLVVIDEQGPLAAQLQRVFEEEVDRLGLDLAGRPAVSKFLEAVHGGVCIENACLARLARAVKADVAVRVTIAPHAPQLALSGKVVDPLEIDVLSAAPSFPKGKDLVASAREALRHVLTLELMLGDPELERLVQHPEPPHPPPAVMPPLPPAVPPKPPEDSRAWMRPARYWAVGIAGAGLAAGALLQWQSAASWREANDLQGGPGNMISPADNDRLRWLEWSAPVEQSLAIASWVAAGAAAGAAVYFFAAAPPAPGQLALSAAPLPGGAAVSVEIALP